MKMLTKKLTFDFDVLAVIQAMDWAGDGLLAKITSGQLDRDLYTRTNKALEAMGGKWNRKQAGHIFPVDPRGMVEGLLSNGTLIIERDGFFETPPDVVDKMLRICSPKGDVLEPSAGLGAIADRLPVPQNHIYCIEKNPERVKALEAKGYNVQCMDFLDYEPDVLRFDRIYMNPPFEENQDIWHVKHAHALLRDDGCLVSIMSEGPFFHLDNTALNFRLWFDGHDGHSLSLPPGSFKLSGTNVNARLVWMWK